MRKILSISVLLLILLSGVTINLAFHYCGGHLADRKVTLTGSVGSCGMEGENSGQSTGYKNMCCENSLSSYTFNNIFIPSPNAKEDLPDHNIPVAEIPATLIQDCASDSFSPEMCIRPPGTYTPSSVQIDMICVFRI